MGEKAQHITSILRVYSQSGAKRPFWSEQKTCDITRTL
nr:MAG TPA_asm: hypothetical protein [Caudoviricetes sp.]